MYIKGFFKIFVVLCFVYISEGSDSVSTSSPQTRIELGDFPHIALIGFENDEGELEYECSGFLINNLFVLTLAHCLVEVGDAKSVLFASLHMNEKRAESKEIDIESIHVHPEFKSSRYYNDIGLIKLKKTVSFDENIKPTCLPKVSKIDYDSLVVAGYDFKSEELSKVNFIEKNCSDHFLYFTPLNEGLADYYMCSEVSHPSMMGGAAVHAPSKTEGCTNEVVGFVIAGKTYIDLYVKTHHFIDWINTVISAK